MTEHEKLLILVGLTGTGKTTAVNALRGQGCRFLLLPNRRDLTDRLIIAHLQQRDGVPVAPVPDRTQRFAYTRRYRELYPGGMAYAVGEWLMVNGQLSMVNETQVNQSSVIGNQLSVKHRTPNTEHRSPITDYRTPITGFRWFTRRKRSHLRCAAYPQCVVFVSRRTGFCAGTAPAAAE